MRAASGETGQENSPAPAGGSARVKEDRRWIRGRTSAAEQHWWARGNGGTVVGGAAPRRQLSIGSGRMHTVPFLLGWGSPGGAWAPRSGAPRTLLPFLQVTV